MRPIAARALSTLEPGYGALASTQISAAEFNVTLDQTGPRLRGTLNVTRPAYEQVLHLVAGNRMDAYAPPSARTNRLAELAMSVFTDHACEPPEELKDKIHPTDAIHTLGGELDYSGLPHGGHLFGAAERPGGFAAGVDAHGPPESDAAVYARIPIDKLPQEFCGAVAAAPIDPVELVNFARAALGLGDADPAALFELRVERFVDFMLVMSLLFGDDARSSGGGGENEPPEKPPLMECRFGSRWYAVRPHLRTEMGRGQSPVCLLHSVLALPAREMQVAHATVGAADFVDAFGRPRAKTVAETIERPTQFRRLTVDPADQQAAVDRAGELSKRLGTQIDFNATALSVGNNGGRVYLAEYVLGDDFQASHAIIDHELETDLEPSDHVTDLLTPQPLPLVRAFSLEIKRWIYLDVRDVREHKYDRDAANRVVIDQDIKSILIAVCQSRASDTVGDIVESKHGGFIILAAGPTGTGKTLTAQTFAETAGRPLYPMSVNEVVANQFASGYDPAFANGLEAHIYRVFRRARRWNAILLMDEGDILLSKRTARDEVYRLAIVGTYLHMLDYFAGVLFITTNRPTALDPAVLSRCSLPIEYPQLDEDARGVIWRQLLKIAKVSASEDTIKALAKTQLNGRQIRNAVRLLALIDVDESEYPALVERVAPKGLLDARDPTDDPARSGDWGTPAPPIP